MVHTLRGYVGCANVEPQILKIKYIFFFLECSLLRDWFCWFRPLCLYTLHLKKREVYFGSWNSSQIIVVAANIHIAYKTLWGPNAWSCILEFRKKRRRDRENIGFISNSTYTAPALYVSRSHCDLTWLLLCTWNHCDRDIQKLSSFILKV